MSSQKSRVIETRPAGEARAPKRARGRLRVSAIMDAGAALFAEKGYAAVTMTEIAARSATAIGSLYRFFPTKDALADALLRRYSDEIGAALDDIEATARAMSPSTIADALFDLMLNERPDRAALVALIDIRPDAAERRTELRNRMRQGLAAILRAARPEMTATTAAACAAATLHLLKGARTLATEVSPDAATELRGALRLYLKDALRDQRAAGQGEGRALQSTGRS